MTFNFLCFEALYIVSAKFHFNKAYYCTFFSCRLYILLSGLYPLRWLELIKEKADSIIEHFRDFYLGGGLPSFLLVKMEQ